jgi:hypothetical protein
MRNDEAPGLLTQASARRGALAGNGPADANRMAVQSIAWRAVNRSAASQKPKKTAKAGSRVKIKIRRSTASRSPEGATVLTDAVALQGAIRALALSECSAGSSVA